MKEFRTKAIINASQETVWRVLTDNALFPKFDPNCISLEGSIEEGSSIKIRSKLSPTRVFTVKVSKMKPNELMVWESGLPFNLFKGVRTFMVIAKDDQTTEFHMWEAFGGLLLGLFSKQLPDLSQAFNEFSQGLKKFVESRK